MRKAVPETIMIDGTRSGAGRGRTGRRLPFPEHVADVPRRPRAHGPAGERGVAAMLQSSAGRGRTGRRTENVAGKRDGVRAAPAGMNGKHRNG